MPSNSDQSWEIRLVLYYNEIFKEKINIDYEQLFKNSSALKIFPKDHMNISSENNFSINNKSILPGKDRIEDRLKFLKAILDSNRSP